jgi:hypothetical protein
LTKYFTYIVLTFVAVALLVPWYTLNKIVELNTYAQLPIPNQPKISGTPSLMGTSPSSNTATISIHTINVIHGNNKNTLIQEEPVLKKVIISNINDALFIAKGSTKNNISVAVNAKIINQLANNRISTTQGLDFTKKLVATELANVINTVVGNNNTSNAAHTGSTLQVVVDNQATCSGIASTTNAACTLLVNIHG